MSGTELPAPPREVAVDNSLDHLAPKFRAAVARVLARLHAEGHIATVAESLRTNDRQEFLWGFGRDYDDGRGVVTQSLDCTQSWHCFGLAVDIVDAKLAWDAPAAFWNALRAAAEAEGLVSGQSFTHKDRPHVQWGHPMRLTPSHEALALQQQGGNDAVWHAVGAA